MSFITTHRNAIGLFCAVVVVAGIGACLLWQYSASSGMSYRSGAATSTQVVATRTLSTSDILASTTPTAAATSSALHTAIPSAPKAVSAKEHTPVQAPITFEVVTTPAAQQLGLSNRPVVPDNYAMLFAFPTDGDYGFWMINMLVPLDMIWLNDDGVIVKIDADVSPATYPNVFYPPQPVKYVLETRAGFAAERGWVVGTKVALPSPY